MPFLHLPALGRCALLLPLAFASLAACSATPQTAAADWPRHITSGEARRNTCDDKAAKFLEQQPYTQDTLQRALAAAGADEARVLLRGQFITEEYKFGRLSVLVDEDMRTVLHVFCG